MTELDCYNDAELLRLLRVGDAKAFTKIYEANWRLLLQISWNHTRDKAAAEDLVHEVFMKLWTNREIYHITHIDSFLVTALKFRILNNYRKNKNRDELLSTEYTFNLCQLDEENLDRLFLEEYIKGIVEQMPEKCKLTFRFSREDGLKNTEISKLMNISEKGSRSKSYSSVKNSERADD